MIYLLEAEVKLTLPGRNIHFVDTVLSRKILEVYDADLKGENVYDPKGTTFLHRFGTGLSRSEERRVGKEC